MSNTKTEANADSTTAVTDPPTGEHADLLESLRRHRYFLRFATRDLTDEQAGLHPTVSALCLGGLVKHVANTEEGWVDFIEQGAVAMSGGDDWSKYAEGFQMLPGETLASVLERYEAVAARTDALVASGIDLDLSHELPKAPWFEPGASWSARRVLLHIIAETSQHAGHADIIRETIDGAKTMG
jgi:uncharacterized damage-inducible protein DinB